MAIRLQVDSNGKKNLVLSRYFSISSKNLKESSIAIFITILTGAFAGIFLSNYRNFLLLLPGLIVLIPGAVNTRGTIFGTMGSRLGSAFHLGLLEGFDIKNNVVKNNIYSSMLLSIYLPVILAIFAKTVMALFGINSISIYELISISFLGSLIAATIMLGSTFAIYELAHRKGWDPDNITVPLITSIGDIVTIPSLFLGTFIILRIRAYVNIAGEVIIILAIVSFILMLRSKENFKKIVLQSILIIAAVSLIECGSGLVLQGYIGRLAIVPATLILLPAFLDEGGNIGSIFASRLTTQLHLGLAEPEYHLNESVGESFLTSYVISFIVYPVVAIVSVILGKLTGVIEVGSKLIVLASLFAGIALITTISIIVFVLAVFFYKQDIDPDNVLIPIVTSLADVTGVISLMLSLHLFGII